MRYIHNALYAALPSIAATFHKKGMKKKQTKLKQLPIDTVFLQKRKKLIEQLSRLRQITITVEENSGTKIQKIENRVVEKWRQKEENYIWQDFLTIYNLRKDQVQKLNLLLPKGVIIIPKSQAPQSVKYTHTHNARKMNLGRQYDKKLVQQELKREQEEKQASQALKRQQELKQAEQALKRQQDLKKAEALKKKVQDQSFYFEPQQAYQTNQTQQNKNLGPTLKIEADIIIQSVNSEATKKEAAQQANKPPKPPKPSKPLYIPKNLKFKGGKPPDEDMEIFAHPVYQDLRDVVILKKLIDPDVYRKRKIKSIAKEFKKFRARKQKERRIQRFKQIGLKMKTCKDYTFKFRMQRLQYLHRQRALKERRLKKMKERVKLRGTVKFSPFENPRSALQLEAIKVLMQKVKKHQLYTLVQQAKTWPSTKWLFQILQAKIKRQYKLRHFQADLNRIFNIFYKRSKEKPHIIRKVKKYQKIIQTAIDQQKILFPEEVKPKEAFDIPETPIVYSRCRKRTQAQNNKAALRRNQVWKNQLRKQRRKNGYLVTEIQRLGKNITLLPKKQMQQFCIMFCDETGQKMMGNGKAFLFEFDLNKRETQELLQMEIFVREKMKQSQIIYKDLSDNDNQDSFVIDNDD